MRRTMATLLLLAWGVPTAGTIGADHAGSAGVAPVARYHVGDLDDTATAGKSAPAKQAPKSSSLQTAGYYDNVVASEQAAFAPASYSTAPSCAQGPSCTGAAGCGQCQCCNDAYCDSLRLEYLMWWTRGRNTPPLLSTGPLDDPAVDVLYGDEDIGTDLRHGARITLNHLFADGCTWGDVRFWGISDGSELFTAASPGVAGSPILARPFFNVTLGTEDALLLAAPGEAEDGSISVLSKNDLVGGDAWFRQNWYDDGCSSVDLLVGYMFSRLDDSISINSISTGANPAVPQTFGVVFDVTDSFRTQNEFHGGQLGFLATMQRNNNLSFELLGKVALGDMRQAVSISGSQIQTAPGGGTTTINGGLLALPTNIGQYERHQFAVAPEINLNLIYDVNPCWRVMAGYSFIYWSNVVLSGNQIDTDLNTTQLPGPIVGGAVPDFDFARTDYWVQGVSFGAEYRW